MSYETMLHVLEQKRVLEQRVYALRVYNAVALIFNIFLLTMLICVSIAEADELSAVASKAPATIDIYADGIWIDRYTSPTRHFTYRYTSFGKGRRVLKVVERTGSGAVTLLNRIYTGTCDTINAGTDAAKKNWCRDVTDYWVTRQTKAKHLFNPAIKAVLNTSIGGTLTELYGADRSYNLISEHGGAAVQLSLWGRPTDGSIEKGVYGFACQPVGSTNWEGMHRVLNPIQASSKNCWYENLPSTPEDEGVTNDVSASGPCGDKCWRITKNWPYNFTRSQRLPKLTWTQTAQLNTDGYLKLEYDVSYDGKTLEAHPQEIPGMFWSLGPNARLYWHGYKEPYQSTPAHWSEVITGSTTLSNALLAYSPVTRVAANPYWSICSNDESRCVTVVYPKQDILRQMTFNEAETGSWYSSALGYFALANGSRYSFRLYIFPKRYDQIPSTLLSKLLTNG